MTTDKPCPYCRRVHQPEPYRCSSCGATFQCASQFSTPFGIWAHRRLIGAFVAFGLDGGGPWVEGGEEGPCGPVLIDVPKSEGVTS